jgi:hypothetical protein
LPSRLRLLVLVPVLALSLGVAACGSSSGGGGSSKDATDIVNTAFQHPIKAATLALNLNATLNGIAALNGPIALQLTGPFESNAGKLPKFDFKANINGGGQSVPLAIRSTGDDLFIQIQGNWYELGKDAVAKLNDQIAQQRSTGTAKGFSAFGVNPLSWLKDAKTADDTTVAGEPVNHASATIDMAKLLNDLNQIVSKANVSGATKPPQLTEQQKQQIQDIVKNPRIDVYVSKKDQTLRRIAADINFNIPQDQQAKVQGLKSGDVKFSLEFSNVGQSVDVSPPANAQPLSSLSGLLGGASALGGSSSGSGSSSSNGSSASGAPSTKQVQEYAKCLQNAGSDANAIQKCASILSK